MGGAGAAARRGRVPGPPPVPAPRRPRQRRLRAALRGPHVGPTPERRHRSGWTGSAWPTRAHARPAELSGGEAQRVALARALAPEPAGAAARRAAGRPRRHHPRRGAVRPPPPPGRVRRRAAARHPRPRRRRRAGRPRGGARGRPRSCRRARPPRSPPGPAPPWAASLAGLNLLAGTATGKAIAVDGGGELVVAEAPDVDARAGGRAPAGREPPPRQAPRLGPQRVDGHGGRGRARRRARRVRVEGPPTLVAEVTRAAAADLELVEGERIWCSVKATEVDVYPA